MATYLEILPELRDDPQDQIRLFFFNIVQTAFVFAVHMYSVTRAVLTMIKKTDDLVLRVVPYLHKTGFRPTKPQTFLKIIFC